MTDFFQNIDEYQSGTLSPEDKQAFEKEILINPSLKHGVENYDLLKKISASLIEDETRQQIQNVKQNSTIDNSTTRLINYKFIFMTAAAVVTMILISFLVFRSAFDPLSDKEIIAMGEKPVSIQVLGSPNSKDALQSAIETFESGNVNQAIPLLSIDFHSDSLTAIASKYLGYIYFSQKKTDLAIAEFETLIDHPSLNTYAHYHLTLCYLFKKDLKSAKKHYYLVRDSLPEQKKIKLDDILSQTGS